MPQELTRPEIVVDLAAIRHNVTAIRAAVAPAAVMMTVKADGYGHGMIPTARAGRDAGAEWLGVATVEEALALRAAGDSGRIAAWLDWPAVDYASAIAAGIDLTAYSLAELDRMAASGPRARVQLKVDTGLSRGGCPLPQWPALVARAAELERAGRLTITGVWSHLATGEDPRHPSFDRQAVRFDEALAVAREAGLQPEVVHLANSAAALLHPQARYDLVRVGIAAYGLDPAPDRPEAAAAWGLIPAMTVRAPLALCKPLAAGEGVSYGHLWIAPEDTTIGLVPLGYGDGIPRHATNRAEVAINGVRRPVRGRICMDQFVVDLGGDDVAPGTPVTVWGPGTDGEPTATEWAEACGTINYEIVTRIGGRLDRRYVGGEG